MDSGRYINPYTDYGFKYFFGSEPNKDLTLHFVNALLQGREVIKSLHAPNHLFAEKKKAGCYGFNNRRSTDTQRF